MKNETIKTTQPETLTIFQAIEAVLENPKLKFVAKSTTRPGRKFMIYADGEARVWDFEDNVIVVSTFFDYGVCMRSDARFPDTILRVDETTKDLVFEPYAGTLTDFVNKTVFVTVDHNSVIALDIDLDDDVLEGLGASDTFLDPATGIRYYVQECEGRFRSNGIKGEEDFDGKTYDAVRDMWYTEEYDPYIETLIYVAPVNEEGL